MGITRFRICVVRFSDRSIVFTHVRTFTLRNKEDFGKVDSVEEIILNLIFIVEDSLFLNDVVKDTSSLHTSIDVRVFEVEEKKGLWVVRP